MKNKTYYTYQTLEETEYNELLNNIYLWELQELQKMNGEI